MNVSSLVQLQVFMPTKITDFAP